MKPYPEDDAGMVVQTGHPGGDLSQELVLYSVQSGSCILGGSCATGT